MKKLRLFSALTAAVMSVCAVPMRIFADEFTLTPISTIEISGITAKLIRGETPEYTLRLSDESAMQMQIADECWIDTSTQEIAFSRSGGEPVPLSEDTAYRYTAVLQANDGYAFTERFELQYEKMPIGQPAYSYVIDGSRLQLTFNFIPLTLAEYSLDTLDMTYYGDLTQDEELSIADAVLLMRLLVGDDTAPITAAGMQAADFDRDGVLTITDVTELLWYLSGHIPEINPKLFDDSLPDELPQPAGGYVPLTEGNSLAFTETPLPGLTVSAEENALAHDGQLQFSALTEEKQAELSEKAKDYGIAAVKGWEVNAGLDADSHLPGYYHSEFDLSSIEMPEELYDSVKVIRVDDNGNARQYITERDGSKIKWDSDQNSFVIIGIIAVGAAVFLQIMQYHNRKIETKL